MTTEKQKHDTTAEILLLGRNNRFKMLMVGVLSFIISMIIFKLYVVRFKAYTTFFVTEKMATESSGYDTEKDVYAQLSALSKDRLFLLIYSDEMSRRLDDEIQIGKHYGLDKEDPYYYRDINIYLRKKINLQKGAFSTVTIEVTDYNMEYSAFLANAIFENLSKIQRGIINKNLLYKVSLYNASINKLQYQTNLDIKEFKSALEKLQNGYRTSASQDDLLFLKTDLMNSFNTYTSSSIDLKKQMLQYQVNTDIARDTSIQNLYLVNKAYPQRRLSAYIYSAVYSGIVAFALSIYYIVMLYFYRRNRHYFDILFKKGYTA